MRRLHGSLNMMVGATLSNRYPLEQQFPAWGPVVHVGISFDGVLFRHTFDCLLSSVFYSDFNRLGGRSRRDNG